MQGLLAMGTFPCVGPEEGLWRTGTADGAASGGCGGQEVGALYKELMGID